MRIDAIHKSLAFVVEQEEAGYFNPERYDMALDMASMNKFKGLLPIFGMNEVINESLTPFKRPFDVTNSNSQLGLITLPADYEYISGILKVGYDNVRMIPTTYAIEVLNDDELGDRLRSQMMPVTVERPVAQRLANDTNQQQIQLYPKAPNVCTINYLKRPNRPVYGYSLSGPDNLVVTYDDTISTQMNWKETDIYDVMFGALTILGVNLDDEKIAKYGMMLQTKP